VHRVFNPTLYVPLQKKGFDTVEIDMMIATGDPVPFLSGKSFVVLEIRRVIHPYFAIQGDARFESRSFDVRTST